MTGMEWPPEVEEKGFTDDGLPQVKCVVHGWTDIEPAIWGCPKCAKGEPSPQVEGAVHYDQDKTRVELLPIGPLMGAAEVFTLGARKYAERNWERGMRWGRLYGSLLRHLWSWWRGQDYDAETGKHHLDHATCCLLMLRDTVERRQDLDDRPGNDKG